MTTNSPVRKRTPVGKQALTRRLPDGTIQALSSDGHTVYTVTLGDQPTCTCRGFINRSRCYHVTTASQRYAAFYAFPAAYAQRRPANISDLYADNFELNIPA